MVDRRIWCISHLWQAGFGEVNIDEVHLRSETTDKLLMQWAEPHELVSAKFFFWRQGTLSQKSMEGLIRGLLISVISQAPHIIQSLFPDYWNAANQGTLLQPKTSHVAAAFKRLVNLAGGIEKYRFVFFIDGLDEFEGDHDGMVQQLLTWYLQFRTCQDVRFQQGVAGTPVAISFES